MDIKALGAVATAVRVLSADAIEVSGTGHPGMLTGPLGAGKRGGRIPGIYRGTIRETY